MFRPFWMVLVLAAPVVLSGQTKAPATPADYGQWERLTVGGRGPSGSSGLSPDGKWIVYGINRSNGKNELRVTNIASGTTKTTDFGSQPAFSSNSAWLAFAIGYSEDETERMRKENKPVENKLGLLNLASGERTVVDSVESFAFSPTGGWIAMRRYPPRAAATTGAGSAGSGGPGVPAGGRGAPGSDEDAPPPGATLILRDLTNGKDVTLGNVSEYVWQDRKRTGTLLALTINTADKTGNGLQLFDTKTGTLKVLDSAAAIYSNLTWRKDGADLAALKSKTDDKHDGPTQIALAWTHLGESTERAMAYDPTADKKFPAATAIASSRRLSWSDDGTVVYLGLTDWSEKPPAAERKDNEKAKSDGGGKPENSAAKENPDQPSVDVWHWRDNEVMAHQVKNAAQNRRRSLTAAWHTDTATFTKLGESLTTEQVAPFKHRKLAYATEWKEWALERSIGRPAADIYLVDLDGKRTKVKGALANDPYLQPSPGGRYLLYIENDHYWTLDTASREAVNITKSIRTPFLDLESDFTQPMKPPFGVAGWTRNDAEVILYDKFDLWKVAADGRGATRLTNGVDGDVRHRYIKLDPDEDFIDLDKPVYLSLFGIWSKKSGVGVLKPGAAGPERLIWGDKSIDRVAKASDADVFQYVSESFEDPANLFVAGPDLKEAKRITDTNPFQTRFAWGRSELIEYKSAKGTRLQGALFYPAGYEHGKKYPMIVYMYEKLSDNLHRYYPLSEREYYNPSAMVSHGYFVLQPDIVFQKREPGVSVVECVTAAVKKVLEKPDVDEKRIGVIGHSWGGFDAAYLATHTHAFAAAVAGAPITDLVSNYGNHHWISGIAETDHIETGQQRMEVPLYEDLQAYIRNSAVFGASTMTTPLLIEVGDSDGTVFYHQGIELYNIARRAKKNVVLLLYSGEDHGLRKKANQVDYQRRIFAWFDYYLKGDQAAKWIVEGESYLDHQRAMKGAKVE
jgi:dipeptidyl aminopeptidase/acylaminoacyl peptidase